MHRTLVALLAIGAFIGANALSVSSVPTCDVGEQEKVPALCNAGGEAKCTEYCQKKFGAELVGSACAERPNKKRECICKLKCCNSGCWGDPHCWTCDGVRFGYQGLKKYFVLKPINKYPSLPYFEIQQSNKVWQNGPMSILDVSEVLIVDWSLHISLKVPNGPDGYILTVNTKNQNIPYRFSELHDNREHFVNIVYGNDQKTQVVLTTSFGLRIVYTTKGSGTQVYSDISIDIPRHPELKDNSHGLLGRWNGNPDDDSIDANGKKQPLDDQFSWAFGDSWIVPGGRTLTAECVRNDAVKKQEEHEKNTDPKVKENAEKLCREVLGRPELKRCARKLRRALPLVKNCVIDLTTLATDNARKEYIENVIESFSDTCKRRGHGFAPKGSKSSSSSESKEHGKKRPHGPGQKQVVAVPVVQIQPGKPVIQVQPVKPVIQVVPGRPVAQKPKGGKSNDKSDSKSNEKNRPNGPKVGKPVAVVHIQPAKPVIQVQPVKPVIQVVPARPVAQKPKGGKSNDKSDSKSNEKNGPKVKPVAVVTVVKPAVIKPVVQVQVQATARPPAVLIKPAVKPAQPAQPAPTQIAKNEAVGFDF